MKNGLFITLEGIDGCGKTTQVEKLVEKLTNLRHLVLALRDPGGTRISEQIRNIVLSVHNNEMNSLTELLLYEAARAQIVAEKIKPALQENKVVIMDRFYDSTTAYQGYGRNIDIPTIEKANHIATGGLSPNITFFIDITWEESRRRRAHSRADRMEQENHLFFNRIRDGYLQLSQQYSERIHVVDGSQHPDVIAQIIFKSIQKFLV